MHLPVCDSYTHIETMPGWVLVKPGVPAAQLHAETPMSEQTRNERGSNTVTRTDGGSNNSMKTVKSESRDETGTERTGDDAPSSVEEPALDEEEPDIDVVFDILGTSRRRAVIRYLETNPGPISIGELADYIAAQEYDKTQEEVTQNERKRVYVSLYQSHLPKMTAADVIAYEQGESIEQGPYFETFATMLAHADATVRGEPEGGILSSFLSNFLD